MVLAVEAEFLAAEGVEKAGRLVEGVEGGDGLGWRVFVGDGIGLEPLDALLIGDLGGLEGPAAEDAPAAEGHGFDEGEFVGGVGVEFGGEVGQEFEETLAGFAGEEDGLGEHAVFEGVLGGVAAASGGDGASGFWAVEAVGCELFF